MEEIGGYEVEVTEKYQDAFDCGICLRIIKKATNGCECHVFCESCIKKHLDERSPVTNARRVPICPGGCRKNINPSKLFHNVAFDLMINKLKTKCSNEDCTWTGDLLDLFMIHQEKCDYLLIKCPKYGCHELFYQQDIENHEEKCCYKPLPCSYCQVNVIRMDKAEHEEVCAMEIINCTFYDVGCITSVLRKDVDKHEQDNQSLHVKLSFQYLKKENNLLKNEVNHLKQENNDLKEEVRISDLIVNNIAQNSDGKKLKDIIRLKEKFGNKLNNCAEIQDDNSLIIKLDCANHFIGELLKQPCYQSQVSKKLKKQDKKVDRYLLYQLLLAFPYYWHEDIYTITVDKAYVFCFPTSENGIGDFYSQYKNCIVKCKNKEIEVQIMEKCQKVTIDLSIDGQNYQLKLDKPFNPFLLMACSESDLPTCGVVTISYDESVDNDEQATSSKRKKLMFE